MSSKLIATPSLFKIMSPDLNFLLLFVTLARFDVFSISTPSRLLTNVFGAFLIACCLVSIAFFVFLMSLEFSFLRNFNLSSCSFAVLAVFFSLYFSFSASVFQMPSPTPPNPNTLVIREVLDSITRPSSFVSEEICLSSASSFFFSYISLFFFCSPCLFNSIDILHKFSCKFNFSISSCNNLI